jgi:hypothetical protein
MPSYGIWTFSTFGVLIDEGLQVRTTSRAHAIDVEIRRLLSTLLSPRLCSYMTLPDTRAKLNITDYYRRFQVIANANRLPRSHPVVLVRPLAVNSSA